MDKMVDYQIFPQLTGIMHFYCYSSRFSWFKNGVWFYDIFIAFNVV